MHSIVLYGPRTVAVLCELSNSSYHRSLLGHGLEGMMVTSFESSNREADRLLI
jgi:hypothetical protein